MLGRSGWAENAFDVSQCPVVVLGEPVKFGCALPGIKFLLGQFPSVDADEVVDHIPGRRFRCRVWLDEVVLCQPAETVTRLGWLDGGDRGDRVGADRGSRVQSDGAEGLLQIGGQALHGDLQSGPYPCVLWAQFGELGTFVSQVGEKRGYSGRGVMAQSSGRDPDRQRKPPAGPDHRADMAGVWAALRAGNPGEETDSFLRRKHAQGPRVGLG